MKIRLRRINGKHPSFLTCGYWSWSELGNHGTLTIEVSKMDDWRHEVAIWGHEILEVIYCWLFHVTTEEADKFDALYERGYQDGSIPKTREPGHDPRCCYHWGHMAGVCWEHFWIFLSCGFGGMKRYCRECDRLMGIPEK